MNSNLNKARVKKDDEWYTRYKDIQEELGHYKDQLKDKVVLLNCDDYRVSNFYKYFKDVYFDIGIKEIICFNKGDDISYLARYKDGVESVDEVSEGGYSSPIGVSLIEECDVVVTNPPFSLFRDYYDFIKGSGKDFLILANMNMVSYVPLFKDIKNNTTKFGVYQREMKFDSPEGEKSLRNACWLSNLDVPEKDFHKLSDKCVGEFDKFDGTDVINVNRWKDFPDNYFGIAGVPISALPKINREQLNVIGYCNNKVNIGVNFHSIVGGKSVYLRVIVQRKV